MTEGPDASPPTVTVLIPARDEARDVPAALDAIAAQDHPRDRMEVVVVDGASTDGTADVARRCLAASPTLAGRVLSNPAGTTPSNLNVGLAAATGEVVCRVDARSLLPPDYVRSCAELLRDRADVAVVGRSQVAVARSRRSVDVGIARALNNRYATGLSRYRRATSSGPSDTVYLGAFRTADLRAEGGWDERLGTNQDFDLNRRMAGRGLVWFDAGAPVGYLPRSSLRRLLEQHVRFGRAKVAYWRATGDRPRPRQLALMAGPAVAAVAAAAWLGAGARPARRTAATLAAGLAAGLAVDHLGTKGPDGGPAARLAAVAAMAAVGGGWWTGVVAGMTRRGS